ncbi:carbohydrate ABC transporter permease [Bacillus timonensis]|uniref:Carbohydrate ABC transporter permease n=1 Tax=Bacillus timonensis TaxID=1033734 RepID=A0A4S3PQD8_9BACI|nr:carbohydrate ABC transporter permease [Bacillus timonensis]THE11850.1 carbohydrate ABC transporter permease [Bacillus timonensis]
MRAFRISNIGSYVILFLMALFVLLPFFWTVLTSLKTEANIFSVPPQWIPNPVTFDHYADVLREGQFQAFMKNSLIVSISSTLISLAIGIPGAYGFAKYRYRLSGILFGSIIAVRMFPPIVLGVPYFLMMIQLGLIDSKLGLIITYLPLQLTLIIWIMEGFFRELPHEIEEAGEIDGLGSVGKFIRIALPLSLPSIVVATIFSFLQAWNEFLFALTLTRTEVSQTMPVGIAGYVTTFSNFWGKMAATDILFIIPVLLITIFIQRGLIKGLTAGASKG